MLLGVATSVSLPASTHYDILDRLAQMSHDRVHCTVMYFYPTVADWVVPQLELSLLASGGKHNMPRCG